MDLQNSTKTYLNSATAASKSETFNTSTSSSSSYSPAFTNALIDNNKQKIVKKRFIFFLMLILKEIKVEFKFGMATKPALKHK